MDILAYKKRLNSREGKIMICKVCGRNTENQNANFCEYCGSSYRLGTNIEQQNISTTNINQDIHTTSEQETEKPISTLHWICCMLIFFIPIIGWIAYPVMLFVWAFSNNISKTKRNWARASLIIIFICIIMVIGVLTDFVNSGGTLNDLMGQSAGEFY